MKSKKVDQQIIPEKKNKINWATIVDFITKSGITECVQHDMKIYDDGSHSYMLEIHINPPKKKRQSTIAYSDERAKLFCQSCRTKDYLAGNCKKGSSIKAYMHIEVLDYSSGSTLTAICRCKRCGHTYKTNSRHAIGILKAHNHPKPT